MPVNIQIYNSDWRIKEQTVVDKLLSAGLSLDDIKLLKNEIIL